MAQWERDERLARAFLELADTLTQGFYLIDFLHVLTDHMLELLDVSAIGVILVDARGQMLDVTASTHTAHQLEEAQIEFDEGPSKDCCYRRDQVGPVDLNEPATAERWPRFTKAARTAQFATVAALPLRLRDEVIGAVNVFHSQPTGLHPASLRLGQALADAATIGILHQRLSQDQAERIGQLQIALNSRIIIEQAKGALTAHLRIAPEVAFERLRAHARSNQTSLTRVCQHLVEGRLAATTFATPQDRPHHP
ncbi:ANTAR domain-containing protein [Streptomyces sp. NPDC051684]|uniref:ANTAR domain-containing protein n=1 Tax=Streptomyces sp. NPDC051684 TaxID=3365670 RepID=UPI003795C1AF